MGEPKLLMPTKRQRKEAPLRQYTHPPPLPAVSDGVIQKALFSPACASTAFAVCLDLILPSTGKCLPEMGLNQISWSPRP